MTQTSIVPCNGCRLCCQNDAIVLHPEKGDNPSLYTTVPFTSPINGAEMLMLDHKSNGDCIYLGEKGCEIYEKRPLICREFDCRKLYLKFTKPQRIAIVSKNLISKATIEAGKKRLGSLTQAERQQYRSERFGG